MVKVIRTRKPRNSKTKYRLPKLPSLICPCSGRDIAGKLGYEEVQALAKAMRERKAKAGMLVELRRVRRTVDKLKEIAMALQGIGDGYSNPQSKPRELRELDEVIDKIIDYSHWNIIPEQRQVDDVHKSEIRKILLNYFTPTQPSHFEPADPNPALE